MKPIDLRKSSRTTGSARFHPFGESRPRQGLREPERHGARRTISKRLPGWLFRNLSRTFRQIDGDVISDAVSRACLGHWRNPTAFKAHCGVPLDYYLLFVAARYLAALVGTQQRSH